MNRGKDDEKITGPMFPRLHVNDADKGGPRAPPRNKMALYEQLSIPSQRFNSGSLPPNQANSNSNLDVSGSSSQGGGPDRNSIISRDKPPTPTNLNEKYHAQNSDRTNTNIPLAPVEQRKKVADVDDFAVPVFFHSGTSHQSKTQNGVDREKLVPLNTTYSGHVIKPQFIRYPKKPSDIHPSSRIQSEGVSKVSVSNIDRSVEATLKLTSEKTDGHEKVPNAPASQKHSGDPTFDMTRFHNNVTCIRKDSTDDSLPKTTTHRDANESLRVIEEASVSQSRTGSRLGGYYGSHPNNGIQHHGDNRTRETSQLGNQDNGDEMSETSVVDSISGLDISPDDVVGIIGQKHFWKARKAISTQQRVFAVQVFELHRLIKVQKLIAGSPILTHEGSKPTLNPTPANNISTETYIVKPPPHTVIKRKDDSEKPNQKIECSADNLVGKKSLSVERNVSQPSTTHGPTPQAPPVLSTDPKMNPWFHQSQGQQQWLVPIMSPSEGLVYKPYGGPGFPGAFCGGACGPYGPPTPMPGNFMNLGYGIPPNHNHHPGFGVLPPGMPPVGPGYFNPYGMPAMMNPTISNSAETNQFFGPGQGAEHLPNFHMQNQGSCNIPSSQKNTSVTQAAEKIQSSNKDNTDIQGSMASSSPGEREQCEVAGPVNDAPVVVNEVVPPWPRDDDDNNNKKKNNRGQPTRVIKVVPRNPRLATESAARIFRSIQKERAI